MEPRRGRWRVWTLPCIFGEERRIKKLWCVFMFFFGEKYGEKREKKIRKNAQNSSQKPKFSVLVQSGVLGAIYSSWHTFWGLAHLVGHPSRVGSPTNAAVLMSLWHWQICPVTLLQFWIQMHIWRSSWTWIEVILVSLERSGCLFFKKLKKLKFQ